jgi:hypothetical protein
MTSLNIRTLVGYGRSAASFKKIRENPSWGRKNKQKCYNFSYKKSCEASCSWAVLLDIKEEGYLI